MKIFFRICFGMALWLTGSAAVIWAQSSNTLSPTQPITPDGESQKWEPGRNGPFEFRTAIGLFPGGCCDWHAFLDWRLPIESLLQPEVYLEEISAHMEDERMIAYTPCSNSGMAPMPSIFARDAGQELEPLVTLSSSAFVSAQQPVHEEWDGLLFYLSDPDERARLGAVENLVRIRTTGSLLALLTSLRDDPSPRVRLTAAKSLMLLGDIRAVAGLTRAASADPDTIVRQIADFGAQILGGVVAPKPIRESKPSRDLGMGVPDGLFEF